jgi:hypothetical protein
MNRHLRVLLSAATLAGFVGTLIGAAAFGVKWPHETENVPLLVRELFVLLAFAAVGFMLRPEAGTRLSGAAAYGVLAAAGARCLLFVLDIAVDWSIDGYTEVVGWHAMGTSTFAGASVLLASAAQTLAFVVAIFVTNRGAS